MVGKTNKNVFDSCTFSPFDPFKEIVNCFIRQIIYASIV